MKAWSGVGWIVVVYFAIALIGHFSPRDDSDAPDGTRSGMSPRTDHLTGCQYLVAPWGGITPRLDRNGGHVCQQTGRIGHERR